MRKFFIRLGKWLTLAVFVCLLLATVLFITLKRGISIDHVKVGKITINQCRLRLENKLHVTIGGIILSSKIENQGEILNFSTLRKVRVSFDLAAKYFNVISIKNITIGDTSATFALHGDGTGGLSLTNPAYSLATTFTSSKSLFTFNIQEVKSNAYRSRGSGKINLDVEQKKFVGDIQVDVAQTLPLHLHVTGDGYKVSFAGKGTGAVGNIRPVVELFNLGPDIQPWITDALKAKSFTLDVIKGTIPYAAPGNVFRTLYGKASVQDCEYSFEPKLPPITSSSTVVVFENGVLKIYPQKPAYAGVDAGKSWLDIDFNSEDPLLNAHFRTETGLSDEILNLLNFYDIHLPFKQTEGITDADLRLSIDLAKIKVSAEGTFKLTHGTFLFRQKPYTVTDSTVLLSDDKVTVKEMHIDYQDMAKLKIDGKLDFGSKKEDLNIIPEKFDLPWQGKKMSLDTSKNVIFQYHRKGNTETFTAPESDWQIGTIPIRIEGFTIPVEAEDPSGNLAGIHIDILPYCRVLLSGNFNLKTPTFNFLADIQGLAAAKVKLGQQHLLLKLDYTKELEISSDSETQWLIKGEKLRISPFKLKYSGKMLAVERFGLRFEDFLKGTLHGIFDLSLEKGFFVLDQLIIDHPGGELPDFTGRNLVADLAFDGGTISVAIPQLGLSYQRNRTSSWVVHIEELGKFYDRSKFLQKYNLNRGAINIWKAANTPLMFTGNITYPYSLLVKNNIPVNEFDFKGQYENGYLDATINDDLHLHYVERMQISSNSIGYNFSAIRSYLEDHIAKEDGQSKEEIPDFDLQADKTSLYLNPSQSAPAEQLQIHSEDGKLTAQLRYGKGKAEFQMNNENFTLLGQDFGEKFLDGILKDSQFIGGKLSFYVSGLLTKFRGVVKIENSVIKNGVILNNIMAFISTVPDLITFSLPGYSLQGMPFRRLYAGFVYDNHTIDVKTFAVESNALDMTGTGNINLVKNSIKMNIDLISKTKKYVSKIPLLGYILVGDTKQPTVTLKVEGKLDDPDVNTSAYVEIVKTPFDILFRTISLPSHILEQLEKAATDSSDSAVSPKKKGNGK